MASKPAEPVRPLIVKRITIQEAAHHGGAWKVAYADFVTALMAFFLLLWLLGATDENKRKGLADYFTPTLIKTKQESAGADGLLGGSSITDVDSYPNAAGQTGTRTITIPRDATGGPKEGASAATAAVRQKAMQARIEERLGADKGLRRLLKQVRVMPTPEGVRIDLVDDADFSMFTLGTTSLVPEAAQLLRGIGTAVAEERALLVVRGHTDALQWKEGRDTNNWSLSTGRAEATRQALMRSGVAEGRFNRIEGVAAREPLIPGNPLDPRNRRISIVLLD